MCLVKKLLFVMYSKSFLIRLKLKYKLSLKLKKQVKTIFRLTNKICLVYKMNKQY